MKRDDLPNAQNQLIWRIGEPNRSPAGTLFRRPTSAPALRVHAAVLGKPSEPTRDAKRYLLGGWARAPAGAHERWQRTRGRPRATRRYGWQAREAQPPVRAAGRGWNVRCAGVQEVRLGEIVRKQMTPAFTLAVYVEWCPSHIWTCLAFRRARRLRLRRSVTEDARRPAHPARAHPRATPRPSPASRQPAARRRRRGRHSRTSGVGNVVGVPRPTASVHRDRTHRAAPDTKDLRSGSSSSRRTSRSAAGRPSCLEVSLLPAESVNEWVTPGGKQLRKQTQSDSLARTRRDARSVYRLLLT